MSGTKEEVEARPLGKMVKVLLGVWLMLGVLPVFSKMLGFDFLPSIEWMSTSSFLGTAAGLISAASLLWFVLKDIAKKPDCKWTTIVLGLIGTPLLGYFLGRNVVVLVGPMALALIAGQQVGLPFTVAHTDSAGGRGCRSPIGLQGLPFVFDSLCDVPDDVRMGFAPGNQVVVTGRGTIFGVYAESLQRVDLKIE
jgi:hypothetical protein